MWNSIAQKPTGMLSRFFLYSIINRKVKGISCILYSSSYTEFWNWHTSPCTCIISGFGCNPESRTPENWWRFSTILFERSGEAGCKASSWTQQAWTSANANSLRIAVKRHFQLCNSQMSLLAPVLHHINMRDDATMPQAVGKIWAIETGWWGYSRRLPTPLRSLTVMAYAKTPSFQTSCLC